MSAVAEERPPEQAGLNGEGIIFVCDWIPPEFGAVGQYAMKRARDAAREGARVTLIGLGSETSETTEEGGALRIVRLAAPRNPKESLLKRAFWALGVNARLARATRDAQAAMGDCSINVSGSPPLLSYWVLLQNRLFWKKKIVYRMTDFYPEVALAAGKARWLAWAKPVFKMLRRTAHQIELLGYDQAARLGDDPVLTERITIWRDSSPIEDWGAVSARERPFKAPYRILLYSGNLGVAHETDTICEAYRRHVRHGSDRVRLWINGTGVRIARVKHFCETHGLPLAVSPPAPLAELAGVLKATDAHLITLEEPFWGYVFPSKTYACIEAGQPIFYVGPQESDVHRLCTQFADTYWQVNPGDVESCLAKLEALGNRDNATARLPRRIDFGTQLPLQGAS